MCCYVSLPCLCYAICAPQQPALNHGTGRALGPGGAGGLQPTRQQMQRTLWTPTPGGYWLIYIFKI